MSPVTRLFVVDASVCLKWALDDEEAVSQAVALRDEALRQHIQMVAPSLWLYEVINGMVSAVRRGRVAANVGAQALAHLLSLGIHLADPEAKKVYECALRYGIAAYDAAYLTLAEALETVLWTGDRRLYTKVRHATGRVHWIGTYAPQG